MPSRILIAGGYGFVGSNIARQIRHVRRDAELVLAGRNPEQGAALARELGNARTAALDVENHIEPGDLASFDLIISALYDPSNWLIETALTKGIAHIGITTKADDVAAVVFGALHRTPKRPIVLLGHCMAGMATLVAQETARRFRHIDTIEIAALYDIRDAVGPMMAGDAKMLVERALMRDRGRWFWVDGSRHARRVQIAADVVLRGYPAGLLDTPSLGALTGAANIRLDMVQGDSLGTLAGRSASSDVYIDVAGTLESGAQAKLRTIASDPRGLAHFTALGVTIAAERVLGLDGVPAAPGGLYLPETLIAADAAIALLEQFGIRIHTEETLIANPGERECVS